MNDPYNVYVQEPYTKFINKSKVKTIFEVGAMECNYTQEIIDYYNFCEELHIFECNPYTADICKKNIDKLKRNNSNIKKVKFNNIGISNCKETLEYYPVFICNNYGSSSAGFYPTEKAHGLLNENKCKINCTTIDEYCAQENIKQIDLILIDIEGSELKAFQGAKNILQTVSYIIAETQDVPRYDGTPLRKDIKDFLSQYGFEEKYTTCNGYFGDSIFVKE